MNSVRAPYDLTEAAHDYPAWHGPPRRTVLICTHPRSGSTLLSEALYFAGGLGCPLEYFHSGFRPGLAARWRAPALANYIRAAHRWRTDPDGTFAAKLFWPDLVQLAGERAPGDHSALDTMPPEAVPPATYRAIGAQLAAIFPNPRFVYLERRDRVRLAISGMAALHSGRWRVVAAAGAPAADERVPYDRARIDAYIAAADACHAHWRNLFAAIGAAPYRLSYEALTADYDATIAATLAWLGSEAPVPPARLQRQAGSPEEAVVLRYLRDRATGSQPDRMLQPEIHRRHEP